jgi:uncharacterized membrane protein YdjX (TVP38/TMEM64 family)
MTKKLILIAILASLIGAFFYFGLHEVFNLQYLQEKRGSLIDLYNKSPFLIIGAFFLVYVAFTALSLPAATILTLGAGAIFGFWVGLLLVSFASSIGATLAFLMVRYVLRDSIEAKFSKQLTAINQGVNREGWLYLFSVRLVPVFPFFMINSVFALTQIKTFTFYWASQIGMLAGTAVFVNAGTQLSTISSVGDIASPKIIGSFLVLAIFPFIAKFVMSKIRNNQTAA